LSSEDGRSLVENLLESETKAELLLLFRRNPGLVDEIEGVARRIGKKGNSVQAELADLVKVGIVQKKRIGKSEVYCLNSQRDDAVQAAVGNYLTGIGK
jgi:predicted transcriptional regulator